MEILSLIGTIYWSMHYTFYNTQNALQKYLQKTKLKAIENSYYIWNETTYRNKIVSKTKV